MKHQFPENNQKNLLTWIWRKGVNKQEVLPMLPFVGRKWALLQPDSFTTAPPTGLEGERDFISKQSCRNDQLSSTDATADLINVFK